MSALETTYQELLYATKAGEPIGAGSRFTYAILSRSDDAERRNMAAAFLFDPQRVGNSFVTATAGDSFLQSVIEIANDAPLQQDPPIGVTKRGPDLRASGGAFRVNVAYPWLESSYDTGYIARRDTEVSITRVSPVQHALSFEEALGIDSNLNPVTLISDLTPEYREKVTLEGRPPSSYLVEQISIALSGIPFASVSFRGKLGDDLPSEVARVAWATFVATKIIAVLATLRVLRAAYLAAHTASIIDKSLREEAKALFEQTLEEISQKVGFSINNEPSMVKAEILFEQISARQYVNKAIGFNIVEALERTTEARSNVLVTLKRIANGRFIERDSVTQGELVYKMVRDRIVQLLFGKGADVNIADDDLIRAVRAMRDGSHFANLSAAVEYMQINVDAETMPFLVTLYRAILEALGDSLKHAGINISVDIRTSLTSCFAEVFEAKPLAILLSQMETEKKSVQNLALLSLIADDEAQSAELHNHLERVRDCIREDTRAEKLNLDGIRALVEVVKRDAYFRPSIGGAYVPGTLRDQVLAAIPEMATKLEETFLAATGVALVLSQNIRRPISLLNEVSDDNNDNRFIDFDREVNADVVEIRRLALGRRAADWGALTALTLSEVTSILMRLEELDAKIHLGSFRVLLSKKESTEIGPEDFVDRYATILSRLRAARTAAVALRSLYNTGITPDLQELQNSITEGNVELDKLDRAAEKLLVVDVSGRLMHYLEQALKTAPQRTREQLQQLAETMDRIPATLGGMAYGKRILEAVRAIRGNAQELVKSYAISPEDPRVPFQTFLYALATLTAAGRLAIFERELMTFMGAEEAQIRSRVEESLMLTERWLARTVARNLASRIGTVTPGRGVDGDEDYNKERIAYIALLTKIADEGTSSYVPIADRISFFLTPVEEERFMHVDGGFSLAGQIDLYGAQQDVYFRQLLNRPIPDYGLTILAPLRFDQFTRDSMDNIVRDLATDFAAHVSVRLAGEHESVARALQSNVFGGADTNDRLRVSALRDIVSATNRYLAALDAFPTIPYESELELEYETVVRIQRTIVNLLQDSELPVPPLRAAVPPRFVVRSRPLPKDLLDLLDSARPLLVGVKRDKKKRREGDDDDDDDDDPEMMEEDATLEGVVAEMAVASNTDELRKIAEDNAPFLKSLEGAVDSAQVRAIDELLDSGGKLIATSKEIVATFTEEAVGEARREQALKLEAQRLDLSLLVADIRRIVSNQKFENWTTVRKWLQIAESLDREMVARIATLPASDRTLVEVAILKDRTAFLNDMKKVAASISSELGKQLRKLSELAAGGADKADKTEKDLRKKIEDITATLAALQNQENGIEALKKDATAKSTALQTFLPVVNSLDSRVKDANRELTKARNTLADVELFNSSTNEAVIAKLKTDISNAKAETDKILKEVGEIPEKEKIDDAKKKVDASLESYRKLKLAKDNLDKATDSSEPGTVIDTVIESTTLLPLKSEIDDATKTTDDVSDAYAKLIVAQTTLKAKAGETPEAKIRAEIEQVAKLPLKTQIDESKKLAEGVSESYTKFQATIKALPVGWEQASVDTAAATKASYKKVVDALRAAPSLKEVEHEIRAAENIGKAQTRLENSIAKLDATNALMKLAQGRQQLETQHADLAVKIATIETQRKILDVTIDSNTVQLAEVTQMAANALQQAKNMQVAIQGVSFEGLDAVRVASEELIAAIEVANIQDERERQLALKEKKRRIKNAAEDRARERQRLIRDANVINTAVLIQAEQERVFVEFRAASQQGRELEQIAGSFFDQTLEDPGTLPQDFVRFFQKLAALDASSRITTSNIEVAKKQADQAIDKILQIRTELNDIERRIVAWRDVQVGQLSVLLNNLDAEFAQEPSDELGQKILMIMDKLELRGQPKFNEETRKKYNYKKRQSSGGDRPSQPAPVPPRPIDEDEDVDDIEQRRSVRKTQARVQ